MASYNGSATWSILDQRAETQRNRVGWCETLISLAVLEPHSFSTEWFKHCPGLEMRGSKQCQSPQIIESSPKGVPDNNFPKHIPSTFGPQSRGISASIVFSRSWMMWRTHPLQAARSYIFIGRGWNDDKSFIQLLFLFFSRSLDFLGLSAEKSSLLSFICSLYHLQNLSFSLFLSLLRSNHEPFAGSSIAACCAAELLLKVSDHLVGAERPGKRSWWRNYIDWGMNNDEYLFICYNTHIYIFNIGMNNIYLSWKK